MPPSFNIGLKLAWYSVLLYWLWSARRVKAPERMEPLFKRLVAYWLPLLVAMLLLGPDDWFGHGLLGESLVPHTVPVCAVGLTLCLPGAALAIWSRHLLGKNWSLSVQVKQGHELIQSGPYRFVRHPIYSGLLLLFTGNALMVGEGRGVLAVAMVFVSFWRKLKQEEAWLTQRFGAAYQVYRQHTKALVPAVL
ncbi:MAG TPA: isoprenylcysteine carboxylmethyltransferase family protein [Xanthomonadaceae bacterium]